MKKKLFIILAVVLGLFSLFCVAVSLSGCEPGSNAATSACGPGGSGGASAASSGAAGASSGTGGTDGGSTSESSTSTASSSTSGTSSSGGASCTCEPRPDLGVTIALDCGTLVCLSTKAQWECQLSGWVELSESCQD